LIVVPDCTTPVADQVREIYAALGSRDLERTARACRSDVEVHVAGAHPLSGTYVGVPAVHALFERIHDLGGHGTFTITSLMSGDDEDEVLVEACVGHGPHVRTIVHRLVLRDGRLAELHEHPMDQGGENAFWRSRAD
jgi:ketosteroid isomerase-like protein